IGEQRTQFLEPLFSTNGLIVPSRCRICRCHVSLSSCRPRRGSTASPICSSRCRERAERLCKRVTTGSRGPAAWFLRTHVATTTYCESRTAFRRLGRATLKPCRLQSPYDRAV